MTPQKTIRKIYMKSNYDRSKTINRKTTKNYHSRAEDPLLLIICSHVSIEALRPCLHGVGDPGLVG